MDRPSSVPFDRGQLTKKRSQKLAPNPVQPLPGIDHRRASHYEIGAWAVETMFALVEGKGDRLLGAHPTLLTCPIVHRGSVAPPAQSG